MFNSEHLLNVVKQAIPSCEIIGQEFDEQNKKFKVYVNASVVLKETVDNFLNDIEDEDEWDYKWSEILSDSIASPFTWNIESVDASLKGRVNVWPKKFIANRTYDGWETLVVSFKL
jgi:hypothetical protein